MTDETDDDDALDTETIECAGCGEPVEVTAYTASVDDDNTYHPDCFPDKESGAWQALSDDIDGLGGDS